MTRLGDADSQAIRETKALMAQWSAAAKAASEQFAIEVAALEEQVPGTTPDEPTTETP